MDDGMLVFIDLFVDSPHVDDVVSALKEFKNISEIYEVTGEFDIVILVKARDIEELRDLLKNKIMKIQGIKSTVSSIVLKSHRTAEPVRVQ
ncbi:MAG: Lrp/AsnC ligand binding domain-containing protein [Candidatus Thermoplasmatota archaeon]|nr:Lrp/AsnC ligand binding domain-containing protein [Candidatus Thermoplasmatota archaeon]